MAKQLHAPTKQKSCIYKTLVRPVLAPYAAVTRTNTAKTKNIFRTTKIKSLRLIVAVTLRNHKRNSDIREDYDEMSEVVR